MIENTDLKEINPKGIVHAASIDHVQAGLPIPKMSRVQIFSPDDWEEFVEEWVSSLKADYSLVRRFAGAGDMGIDVACFTSDDGFGEVTSERTPDQPLVDLLGRAHAYLRALTDGHAANTVEVAALYGTHRAEVSRILPLAFLAPSITAAILNGRHPVDLSARKLSRQIDLPVAWDEQTSLFSL